MQLEQIQHKIFTIRGQKVMFDFDLAELYAVETKVLKQAVRRNIERFPEDFMFQISNEEFETLRSQIVTSNKGGTRYMPFVFTEQGVAMLSGILKSKKAIEINIAIMRAFVVIRQYALSHKDLTEKLSKLEEKFDKKFADIAEALNYLLEKDNKEIEHKQRNPIGYK